MDKFLKDKPNDQFPKGWPPDREVMAKRAEAERALRTAQADEAAAKASDETSDKAKSAAQDEEPSPEPEPPHKEPARKPSPKLEEQDGGGVSRTDPTRPRTARPRPDADRAPSSAPAVKKDDKKKRGKNG